MKEINWHKVEQLVKGLFVPEWSSCTTEFLQDFVARMTALSDHMDSDERDIIESELDGMTLAFQLLNHGKMLSYSLNRTRFFLHELTVNVDKNDNITEAGMPIILVDTINLTEE